MEEVIVGGDSMGFNVLNYVLAKKNVGGLTVELDSLKQQLAGLQKDLEVIQDADLINRVTSIETLLNQDVANLEEVKRQIKILKRQQTTQENKRIITDLYKELYKL